MDYDLTKLKLIAQGGQAEIYDVGDNKVLRILRNPQDEELLKNEIEIMKILKNKVSVPEVYEYLAIDGRPAVIVEKISGDSMLAFIKKHPRKIRQEAALLAQLHLETSKTKVNLPLYSAKERAKFLAGKSTLLSTELKVFIHDLIGELPEGDSICHGDFHPGNIMKSNGGNYIIDWFGAYQGDIISDAAHSYLIMKNVPVIPGINTVQHMFMKIGGNLLAKQYLGELYRLQRFNRGQFSKWMVVKAAERTFYGVPSEKPALLKFIASCYELRKKGCDAASWYRKL